MPADALAVHGLTAEFLADKPLFGAIADGFLAFVGDAPLVAHNAGFDKCLSQCRAKAHGQATYWNRARDRHRWCWRDASIPADHLGSPLCQVVRRAVGMHPVHHLAA